MIKTHYYLDGRRDMPGGVPLKLLLTMRGRTAMIPVGVRLMHDQWDKKNQRIVKHEHKTTLNTYLMKYKLKVDDRIRELLLSGAIADLDIRSIKNIIQEEIEGKHSTQNFSEYFIKVAETRRSAGTQQIYKNALRVCRLYDIHCDGRLLSEITQRWCDGLVDYLAADTTNYAQNTRNIIVGCVRAVLNFALRDGLIRKNPLKGVATPYVQTRKRNLSQAQIRQLWNAPTLSKVEEAGLDFFKFSFLLIAANAVDISKMTPDSIFNGRIEYVRTKTRKHYSIAIVDELRPLLAKWSDDKSLFKFFAGRDEHASSLPSLNAGLRTLCKREKLPPVSTYWARHTWASLAMELEAPIEVISAALGHSYGARVTVGYVNMSSKRVDELNRRVIDFALYDKLKKD